MMTPEENDNHRKIWKELEIMNTELVAIGRDVTDTRKEVKDVKKGLDNHLVTHEKQAEAREKAVKRTWRIIIIVVPILTAILSVLSIKLL